MTLFKFSCYTDVYQIKNVQAMDTLAEIQERHEAVKELERSLLDLHQIFLDMAVLVEAQGEMLDNIEAQVYCIKTHYEAASLLRIFICQFRFPSRIDNSKDQPLYLQRMVSKTSTSINKVLLH